VVASPKPITIVEKQEIRRLVGLDFIVVCCGGGGIPVVREDRTFAGVDGVYAQGFLITRAQPAGMEVAYHGKRYH
jgi:carbamate kinase